jgi:hypothetical protein
METQTQDPATPPEGKTGGAPPPPPPAPSSAGGDGKPPTRIEDLDENSPQWRSRVEREIRKTLRALGLPTDPEEAREHLAKSKVDQEAIEKDRKDLDKYRKGEEEAKRAKMTREEQLAEENETLKASFEQAKRELAEEREAVEAVRGDARVTDVARAVVNAKMLKYAKREFAEWFMDQPKSTRISLEKDDGAVKKWFENFIVENPEFAATKAEPPKEEPKPPPLERRPHTSGVKPPPADPKPTDAATGGKTVKPGPNQMTKAEVKEFAAKSGIRYPA